MQYPGHIVKLGEPDSRIVKALKAQLNRMLAVQRIAALKLNLDDPNFGPKSSQRTRTAAPRSVDLRRAGVALGLAWCCAFVYWCFDEAASAAARASPMVKTAGCIDHWNRAQSAGATRIPKSQAIADPARVQPGMVFIMDFGGGAGHTGLVEQVDGGLMTTIEGNTDASKTREGGGVYRLRRKIVEVNKGFVDYAGV